MTDSVTYYIGLKKYNRKAGYLFGWRRLGRGRYSLDLGLFAIVFEKY